MQENSAIILIKQLEERLSSLLLQHKELLEAQADWEHKYKQLEDKIHRLEKEKGAKHAQIEELSVNAALENLNMDKEALKQYLDEVIAQLDQNISMLK